MALLFASSLRKLFLIKNKLYGFLSSLFPSYVCSITYINTLKAEVDEDYFGQRIQLSLFNNWLKFTDEQSNIQQESYTEFYFMKFWSNKKRSYYHVALEQNLLQSITNNSKDPINDMIEAVENNNTCICIKIQKNNWNE